MDTETNEPQKIRGRSYALDIVLASLVILVVGGGSYMACRAEHLGGLNNEIGRGFAVSVIMLLPMLLVTFVAFASGLIRLFPWPMTPKDELLRLTFFLLPPAVFIGSFFLTTPLAPVFLKGFEQWITQEADIDAIQQWLVTDGHKFAGQRFRRETCPDAWKELPDHLTGPGPEAIVFGKTGTGSPMTVELSWFGFDCEHGLIVGPPTMDTPEVGMIELRENYNEFRRPIQPGVYIFDRG